MQKSGLLHEVLMVYHLASGQLDDTVCIWSRSSRSNSQKDIALVAQAAMLLPGAPTAPCLLMRAVTVTFDCGTGPLRQSWHRWTALRRTSTGGLHPYHGLAMVATLQVAELMDVYMSGM